MGDVDIRELTAALGGFQRRSSDGARAAAEAMSEAAEKGIKAALSSGAAPSAPGTPPARRSGRLQAAVTARPPFPVGSARWEAHTAPLIVYARIHELGGRTGRGKKTYLPPRPYIAPTVIAMRGQLGRVANEAFAREVGLL